MLTCFRTRRRIGAYLDGALDGAATGAARTHVAGCARCQGEVDALRRLRATLREAIETLPPPDWTGFWAGIMRGIEDARSRPGPAPAHSRPRRLPRLALVGATAAVVASVIAWQVLFIPGSGPEAPVATVDADLVTITAAHTEAPGVSLMVYSPPEHDLAVVWVFGSD